ncbi:methyltransferase family protein [Longivirga aurantiaca]|uniref:Methyltransferase family protein n=1 Tax=Longivirga aurantiaca TaxID=1837743 RepID=A0ABW1SZL0_9ACTN
MSGLPRLGGRGGGWVALQFALLGVALVLGLTDLSGWGEAWAGGLRYIGILVLSAGVVVAVLAAVGLGPSLTALPQPRDGGRLRTDGVYGVVRHPMYLSVLCGVLGWALLTSPCVLIPFAALAVVLDLKRQVEEQWLAEAYPEYPAYRMQVRWALVPYLR